MTRKVVDMIRVAKNISQRIKVGVMLLQPFENTYHRGILSQQGHVDSIGVALPKAIQLPTHRERCIAVEVLCG